ncbi:MAG: 3-isopropylmalate dehydratase small subunit [Candidatus Velthaea sp.]
MTPAPRGRAHVFGNNVDTDVILPGQYLALTEPADLAQHAMEGIDPEFARRVRAGDVIVAGSNFGCGSSRENAPLALKGAGVSAVIAASFARIFYRNAINIGLPIFEVAGAAQGIAPGDELAIDAAAGTIRDVTTGAEFTATPFSPFMQALIDVGGLRPYVEARLRERA